MTDALGALERSFRQGSGRAVAALIRVTGDFDLAEEAVRTRSRSRCAPGRAAACRTTLSAWIVTTARNRAIDKLRRERVGRAKTEAAAQIAELETIGADVQEIPDDRLRLLFTCCHPALAMDARVALTLPDGRGAVDPRDRAGIPRSGADARATSHTREAQDPRRRDPVPRAAEGTPAGTSRRRTRRSVPGLQRGATRRPQGELLRAEMGDEAIRAGAARRSSSSRATGTFAPCSR